jgi:cytochrome c peroxidase
MHGQGNFTDARLDDAAKFPVAARNRMGHTRLHGVPDLVRGKLPALQAYQLSLAAPHPAKGTFDRAAARRGKAIFDGKGTCASCHMPPTYSDPGQNLHTPASICTDDFTAQRSPTNGYRTTPLGGLGTRTTGGYYHDGRYRTLGQVVQHYDSCFGLGLTASEQSDVVEYLKSL